MLVFVAFFKKNVARELLNIICKFIFLEFCHEFDESIFSDINDHSGGDKRYMKCRSPCKVIFLLPALRYRTTDYIRTSVNLLEIIFCTMLGYFTVLIVTGIKHQRKHDKIKMGNQKREEKHFQPMRVEVDNYAMPDWFRLPLHPNTFCKYKYNHG